MSSSAFVYFTAGLAALAPVASAVYTAKGDSPSGNAVYTPTLDEVVPAGKAFDITWNATTSGKISITLCKGPSTNCVTTATIADAIENTGSYSWTPSTDLEPSQPTGYGIELIAADGSYQYSTQFGISNSAYSSSSSSSSSVSSSASSSAASSTKAVSSSVEVSATAKIDIVADSSSSSSSAVEATSTAAVTALAAVETSSSSNGTVASATGSMSTATKTGTKSSSTGSANGTTSGYNSTSSPSTYTGGAADLAVSFGGLAVAAGIAVFAL